jgi:hypothetical protein
VLVEPQGVLHPQCRASGHGRPQHQDEVIDDAGMQASGRCHVDDFAVDQLDARIGRGDADLAHAVEVGDRKTVAARAVGSRVRHRFTIEQSAAICSAAGGLR